MKSRLAVVLTFVAVLALCTTAFASDYFVATWGDDGWPGTEAEPWASLEYAVNTISPGDTILVKAGTYAGCRIENSGLPGAVCTLKAEPGATVIVDRPGPVARHEGNIELEWYDNTIRHWVIEGLEVAGAPKHGFDLRDTEYITIRNCYVHDSVVGTGIFMAFSYYPTLENNETCGNGEHGIYQSNSGDYHVFRGNVIHDNYGCGIHMNGDERYKPGDGLISNGLIEDNVIYGNGTGGGAAINGDGAWYNTIRNNLVYDNLAGGITLFETDGAAGSSYNEIYNNTIVFGSVGRDVINIPGSKTDPVGNIVKNNILYTEDSAEAAIMVWGPAALAESDYNVVIDKFSPDEKSFITLAEWQTTYGFDTHSFISTPTALFENPAANDYHLKVGSPAIDAGATIGSVTDDLEGTSRPQGGGYDIGCYEAGGGGPVPPVADFVGNPTQGSIPLTVYFSDLSSGSPTSWDWAFGDTSGSPDQHPSHEYATVDNFTVSLTATNSAGQDTETKVDYITTSSGGSAPVADFEGSPTSGTAPLTVDFTDLSSNSPTSWDWAFGDTSGSPDQHPSHEYAAGDYTVSLTATNSYGQDTETKIDYISVSSGGGGGDYFCDSLTVTGGSIASGSHVDVHASDDTYLVLDTAKLSGKYTDKVEYSFGTDLSSLSSLTVTVECHPDSQTPHRQRTNLWNYSTSIWDQIDERNLTTTSDTTAVISVSSPAPYISPSGEVIVYVRTGDIAKSSWQHYVDLVKITAAP